MHSIALLSDLYIGLKIIIYIQYNYKNKLAQAVRNVTFMFYKPNCKQSIICLGTCTQNLNTV